MAAASTLQDGFQDGTRNTSLWVVDYFEFAAAGSTVSEAGQTLDVTLLGNTGGVFYTGYLSVNSYDMTGDGFFARLVTGPNAATAAEAVFAAALDANNAAAFIISGGTVAARSRLAGGNSNVASPITYVPATHAWFRIRESGGTTFFDTAPATASDPPVPGDWVNLTSAVNWMAVSVLKANIGGGVYNADPSPGHAIWDGFNTGTTSTVGDIGVGGGGEASPSSGRRSALRRPGRGPYNKGAYQRPRVDAFTPGPISAATGLATETDAALALPPIQILAAGMSTETDTALALQVFTPAPLTDRVGSRRNRPGRGPYSLGRMFRPRVDAFPGVPPVIAVGAADETDTAFALLPVQIKAVGRSDETDTALALNAGAGAPVGRADEAASAVALARVQLRAVGLASESETAFSLAGVQVRAAGRADESDIAIALTAGSAGSAGLANEADSALALQGKQARAVGLAAETEAAFALFGVTIRAVGFASESDTALALSSVQARSVGRANESDAAFALVAVQRMLAGIAVETDTALTLAAIGAFPAVPSAFYMYVVPGSEMTYVAP